MIFQNQSIHYLGHLVDPGDVSQGIGKMYRHDNRSHSALISVYGIPLVAEEPSNI